MKVKSDYHIFREIFEKSPVGMLLFDREGTMVDANQSALEIMGITTPENPPKINLFHNPIIPCKKEELVGNGVINFQNQLDFEKISDFQDINKTPPLITEGIEGTISIISSGYLVQIHQSESKDESCELLISGEKYKNFFEDDLTGDFIATPKGEIIECNPAFAEIYKFPNREQALKSNISTFNPEDWETLTKRLKHEYKIQGHQTTHQRPDGEKIHVVSNLVGIYYDSELVQVKGYVFDDTERKEAEEALKRSEEKYHRLFDEDLTGDFIANVDGEILECNPAFADIYGWDTVEKALKWNISESNPFDWPYMVTRLRSEGKIRGFQSWQRRQDFMRIHVVANLVGIFNDSDELIQVKGYVFDDTERKQAEEKLESGQRRLTMILGSIRDGFVSLDNLWNFIYVNPCAAEYLDIDADDLMGQNLWERFPELAGTIHETHFRRAMNEQEIQYFEAQGMLRTGKCLDISVYPSTEGISIYWKIKEDQTYK